MSKEMRKHIDSFKYFLLKENKESNDIIDYYKSKNIILLGMKTNLLPDMKRRYDFEVNGDEIYFFDKGFHFGTLFKEGRFYELKHDGTLDEYGWRKTDDDENFDVDNSKMRLVHTGYGYDFYIGKDEKGESFYNIIPMGDNEPTSGYYNSEWISKMKGVKNVFKTVERVQDEIKKEIMDKLKANGF